MSSDSLESLPTRELIRLVRDLRERFAQLEAENLKLREENRRLRKELDELKRKQNRSAAPFSKGKPEANPKRPGRKPGQGSFRRREEPEIGPDDNVRSMEARLPKGRASNCPRCGGRLGTRLETASTVDVPEKIARDISIWKVEVEECSCGYCARGTHRDLPLDPHGATAHRVGPRVRSFGLALHYHFGVTLRKVPPIVREICGIDLSQSALKLGNGDGAISQEAERIKAAIQQSDDVNTDDTGWRTGGKTSCLMGFVSRQENAVYFQIRSRHRAEEVAEVITAACECVLGTDRFRSYDAERFSQMDMQKCMSHIVKNLSEVLEKKRGRARSFCEGLKNLLRQCLRLWQQYHNGESALNQYEEESLKKIYELDHYLRDRTLKDSDNQRMRNELGRHFDQGNLTMFLEDPEVEPTNNIAERMLRPAIVARKVSQCSKTERGANAYAAFESVLSTLSLRGASSVFKSLAKIIASERTLA